MTTTHRIALLGFSTFERSTLASYFQLASTREPRYEQVQMLSQADFVVADADHEPSVKLVLAVERVPETVFVGAKPPEGAIASLRRPIDPLRALRELDVLAARQISQPSAAQAGGAGDGPHHRRTVIQLVRPLRPQAPAELLAPQADALDLMLSDLPDADKQQPASNPLPAHLPPVRAPVHSSVHSQVHSPVHSPVHAPPAIAAVFHTRRPATAATWVAKGDVVPARACASMPASAAKAAATRRLASAGTAAASLPTTALLVDDSALALRFLQKKLAPFGLITECASHSEGAIKRLAEGRYDFVFLDMELGARSTLDGLGLCQRIKRDSAAANVVMVTAHHTELDRVRGALAGCDGFLGKPLDEEELSLYLARFGVHPAVNAGRMPS